MKIIFVLLVIVATPFFIGFLINDSIELYNKTKKKFKNIKGE